MYARVLDYLHDDRCMLVNYSELQNVVWPWAQRFVRPSLTTTDLQSIWHACETDSTDDATDQSLRIPDSIRQLAEGLLVPLFDRIEYANKQKMSESSQ